MLRISNAFLRGHFTRIFHHAKNQALLAVFALSATSPALGIGNWAAEFALKTCLPAMDDLATVEAMARENNWVRHLPTSSINAKNPKLAEALASKPIGHVL